MTREQNHLSTYQPFLTRLNPSRFADSEQSYVVPLHLCCYLCGFAALEHSPYVPRSYSGVSEKRKAIPSCGFQIPQAFTTIYLGFILLLAEDHSSLREGISRSSLVGVSVAKLVFRGEKAGLTPNPQPGGPECFLSDPSPADQSSMVEPGRSTRLPPAQLWGSRSTQASPPQQGKAPGEKSMQMPIKRSRETLRQIRRTTSIAWQMRQKKPLTVET